MTPPTPPATQSPPLPLTPFPAALLSTLLSQSTHAALIPLKEYTFYPPTSCIPSYISALQHEPSTRHLYGPAIEFFYTHNHFLLRLELQAGKMALTQSPMGSLPALGYEGLRRLYVVFTLSTPDKCRSRRAFRDVEKKFVFENMQMYIPKAHNLTELTFVLINCRVARPRNYIPRSADDDGRVVWTGFSANLPLCLAGLENLRRLKLVLGYEADLVDVVNRRLGIDGVRVERESCGRQGFVCWCWESPEGEPLKWCDGVAANHDEGFDECELMEELEENDMGGEEDSEYEEIKRPRRKLPTRRKRSSRRV